jgi:hypothetical protein
MLVMPGLVPGIHVFASTLEKRRGWRDKPGHDVVKAQTSCPFRLAEIRCVRALPSRLAAVDAMRHDRAE